MENIKIAVIDDESPVLESFKMILKIKDYDVTSFDKVTVFLDSLKKDMFDIVFLDLYLRNDPLPYSNQNKDGGIEALKKIKEIDPNVEVIIVTGYATDITHSNAIALGAMEYLKKPFIIQDIYELVERGIRHRRERATRRDSDLGPIGPIH